MKTFLEHYQETAKASGLVDSISREVHELLRAWCEANGKFFFVPWDEQDDAQKAITYEAVETVLASRSALYANPITPEDMHIKWMEIKEKDGWTYGPEFDEASKKHPSLVPFDELSEFEKIKDSFVIDVTNTFANRIAGNNGE